MGALEKPTRSRKEEQRNAVFPLSPPPLIRVQSFCAVSSGPFGTLLGKPYPESCDVAFRVSPEVLRGAQASVVWEGFTRGSGASTEAGAMEILPESGT